MPHEFGTCRFKIVRHIPVCLYHLPQASAWTWYLEAPWTPTSPTLLAFKLQPLFSSGVKWTILIWLRFLRLPCNQTLSLNFKSSQPFPGPYNSLQLRFSYNCKRYVYEIVAYLAASSRLVISRTTRGDGVITSPTVFPWVLFNSFWISLKACTWMKPADVIERNQIKKHKKQSPICKEQWNSGNKEKIQKRHLQLEIHNTPYPDSFVLKPKLWNWGFCLLSMSSRVQGKDYFLVTFFLHEDCTEGQRLYQSSSSWTSGHKLTHSSDFLSKDHSTGEFNPCQSNLLINHWEYTLDFIILRYWPI